MQTNQDLITIVVPVYNVEPYLYQSLDSITNQTYRNLDIILIDDGSTDNSGHICENCAKHDKRIRVFHKPNGGLSSARNLGINEANGKYICFIDSDDYIAPTYVSFLYDLIIRFNADISICPLYHLQNDRSKCRKYGNAQKKLNRSDTFKLLFADSKFVGLYACNKMYRTKLFETIRYPEKQYYEDSGTTYRLINLCSIIAYGDTPQYYYRINRPGAITSSSATDIEKYRDKLMFMDHMNEFIRANYINAYDAYISKYLYDLVGILSVSMNYPDSALYKDVCKRMQNSKTDFLHNRELSVSTRCAGILYIISPKLFNCFCRIIKIAKYR